MMAAASLGAIVDAVIAFTLVEGALLIGYRALTGRGVALHAFVVNMLAGLCLMLALRAVVRDAGSASALLWLLAAGLSHAADMVWRWQRAARRPSPPAHNEVCT